MIFTEVCGMSITLRRPNTLLRFIELQASSIKGEIVMVERFIFIEPTLRGHGPENFKVKNMEHQKGIRGSVVANFKKTGPSRSFKQY